MSYDSKVNLINKKTDTFFDIYYNTQLLPGVKKAYNFLVEKKIEMDDELSNLFKEVINSQNKEEEPDVNLIIDLKNNTTWINSCKEYKELEPVDQSLDIIKKYSLKINNESKNIEIKIDKKSINKLDFNAINRSDDQKVGSDRGETETHDIKETKSPKGFFSASRLLSSKKKNPELIKAVHDLLIDISKSLEENLDPKPSECIEKIRKFQGSQTTNPSKTILLSLADMQKDFENYFDKKTSKKLFNTICLKILCIIDKTERVEQSNYKKIEDHNAPEAKKTVAARKLMKEISGQIITMLEKCEKKQLEKKQFEEQYEEILQHDELKTKAEKLGTDFNEIINNQNAAKALVAFLTHKTRQTKEEAEAHRIFFEIARMISETNKLIPEMEKQIEKENFINISNKEDKENLEIEVIKNPFSKLKNTIEQNLIDFLESLRGEDQSFKRSLHYMLMLVEEGLLPDLQLFIKTFKI